MDNQKQIIHKIGGTHTIQTAVLVCEYLRQRCAIQCKLPRDSISYISTNPMAANEWRSTDIVVTIDRLDLECSNILVNTCRAFVAGRGEGWA